MYAEWLIPTLFITDIYPNADAELSTLVLRRGCLVVRVLMVNDRSFSVMVMAFFSGLSEPRLAQLDIRLTYRPKEA